MYRPIYASIKLKSTRWHTCVKVTAKTIEAVWKCREIAGISSTTNWKSEKVATLIAPINFETCQTVSINSSASFNILRKLKVKIKVKRWRVNKKAQSKKVATFSTFQKVGTSSSVLWNDCENLAKQMLVKFYRNEVVSTNLSVRFNILFNYIIRSGSWNTHSLVSIENYTDFQTNQIISANAVTCWDVGHLGKTIGTSWGGIRRLVINLPVKSNTRICVGQKVGSKWNVCTGVYSLRSMRYKILERNRFILSDRPLPTFANNSKAAVVPNITWKSLPKKQKQKIK